jgi:hypothetical protein
MTQYVINIGALPNDGTGDPLRTAFNETNLNFNQVFAAGPVLSNIRIANNSILTTNTNGNLVLAPNGVGVVQANVNIVPNAANIRNLGAADRRWSTAYLQYANISGGLFVADLIATGNVTVGGNLSVTGNVINIGNIVTDAKTIQLANTAGTANAASGSGITVGANDAIATFLFNSANTAWTTNIGLQVNGAITGTSIAVSDATIYGNTAGINASFTGTVITPNIVVNNITSDDSTFVTIQDGLDVQGDITAETLSVGGNITGNYIFGNGSQLTGLNVTTSNISNGTSNVDIPVANGNVIVNAAGTYTWTFDTTGNLTIPNNIVGANTIIIDNRTTGNTADIQLFAADDILLQARDRTLGSGTEGGDINIFAGDSAEDGDSSGGDVIIEAGAGGAGNVDIGGSGGFIRIEAGRGGAAIGNTGATAESGGSLTLNAGDAGNNNGNIDLGADGGDVFIESGFSTGNTNSGGDIVLTTGTGGQNGTSGNVQINIPGYGLTTGGTWTFDATGNLTAPGNISTLANVSANYFIGNGSQLTGISITSNSLVNGANSFVLDTDGNVVFEGAVPGQAVNRGLVWDFGANANGVNSQVRQDNSGLSVRAWTENSGNYAASVNIVTNQDANTNTWIFSGDGDMLLAGNLVLPVDGSIRSLFITPAFNSNITGITTGNATVIVTIDDLVFEGPFSGTVTISGVNGTTEADGVWDYQAVEIDQFQLYTDATLTTPVDGTTWTPYVSGGTAVGDATYEDLTVQGGNISVSGNDQTWTFDTAGNLVLPQGGIISEGPSPTGLGNTVAITPSGGSNADQQLLVYPTAAEGNHLHLTSGNLYNTELYLGDDYLYVKLANTGAVVVNSNDGAGNSAQWNFGTDGRLTFPGTPRIDTDSNNFEVQAAENISLEANVVVNIYTDSSGNAYQWQFGDDGNLTVPANGNINGADGEFVRFQSLEEGVVRSGVILNPGDGLVRLESWDSEDNQNFTTSDWSSATYITGGIGGEIAFVDAPNIINFINSIETSRVFLQVNGGTPVPYDGYSSGGNNITFSTTVAPEDSPETVTDFVIYYSTRSRMEMDYDEGELNIQARGLDITINGDQDVDILSSDRIRIENSSNINGITISTDVANAFRTWTFDVAGNLNLPASGNLVGSTPNNNGYLSWNGNSSGDGNGYTTLKLVPDDTREGSDQYLVIDPTAPGHIHIRAGGTQDNSSADLILGGENSFVKIAASANSDVFVRSNSNDWRFGTDGVLTLPAGEGVLQSTDDTISLVSFNTTTGNANSVYLGSSGGLGFFDQEIGGNWLEIFRSGSEPQITVPVGLGNLNIQTAEGINAYNWTFDNTGNLTVPGNIVMPPGASLVGNGASPAPSISGFSNGEFGGNVSAFGNITGGNLTVGSGTITGGNVNGAIFNGNVAFGNGTVGGSGNITGGNISAIGNITGNNLTANGTITSTGKIGYAAGSTVTQTTSRGNGVTINTLAGTVVTVSASMAVGEIDTFSVINSSVDPNNDIVLAQIVSPNQGTYNCIANPAVIGGFSDGFYINIQNISGFTTSNEAITIRFMVIKAPNA